MFNTNSKNALPPMRAGEREKRVGDEYCFSPLPLPADSEYAVDIAHIDVRHDAVTMDIRQVESPDSMMTAGHMLSGLAVFMNGFGLPHRGCADFNGSFAGDCGYRAIRGLMAWVMGSQQAKQSNSRHEEWTWEKTKHIKVWRKRSIIALTYQWKPFSKNSYYRPRMHFIYCHADELNERIQFFKEHLPGAAYEEGKVNVL